MRGTRALPVLAALSLSGCLGDDEPGRSAGATGTAPRTTTAPEVDHFAYLEDFAHREMHRQARRTCRSVPRAVLARAVARESSDPRKGDPRTYDDNWIATLYAEDVRIEPVPLQRAAHEGCLAGLRDARRRR